MKRKITQIGRLFAAAALFFGASSWASAQESVTATWSLTEGETGGTPVVSVKNVLSGSMALEAKFAFAGTEDFAYYASEEDKVNKIGTPTGIVFTKISPSEKFASPTKAWTFTLTPESGVTFTPTKLSVNAARFGTDSGKTSIYVKTASGASVELQKESLPNRAKEVVNEKYSTWSYDISGITPAVGEVVSIEFHVALDGGKSIGLNNLVIEGSYTSPEPPKVAYLCGATETTEGVYNALVAAGMDVTALNYDNKTLTGELEADSLAGYDLVVLAGKTGSKTSLAGTFDKIVGKVPVLSTKAFWYAKTTPAGTNGGNPGTAETPSLSIDRVDLYAEHDIFAGIDGNNIGVFNASDAISTGRYMQSNGQFAGNTPAQTTIATVGGRDAIAEAWVDGKGFVVIPFDANDAICAAEGLTEAGAKLFVNAANYLIAGEQYEVPYYGNCNVSIDTVALTGEHAGKYQLVISATPDTAKIYYTIDGTEPTTAGTLYTDPDTIVKNCMIQAIAVADKWHDSSIDTLQFVNKSIETLPAPTFSIEQNAGKHCAIVTISVSDEYKDCSIYYTTDDSEPTTASTLYSGPFEFYGETATVKAIAAGGVYNDSPVASQAVINENYMAREKVVYTTDFHTPHSEWFYNVDFTYDEADPTKPVNAVVKDGAVWPEGITCTDWTEKDHFRVHIFPKKNTYIGYRQYAGWSFYGETNRRVILQDNKSMWCLGASGKVSAAPDSLFAGPFDIEVEISGTKQDTPIRIYVGDELEGETWELIGESTIANGESGSVVGSYNGTATKYVRFETTATEFYVDGFTVKASGYGELKLQSVSPAGGEYAAPAVLEETAGTFVLTFNNPLAAEQGEDLLVFFAAPALPVHNCTYTIEGNTMTVTRPDAATPLAAGTYQFLVKGVKDVTGQVLESQLNTFYKVEGSSSSVNAPEVEKTVVSTVIYSISGAVQSELAPGLNFVRTTYSDGTVEVEKVIKK